MKSPALKELIKTIFSDESARSEFESHPEEYVTKYNLTEAEKRAVLTTHTKMGVISNGSLVLDDGTEDLWL